MEKEIDKLVELAKQYRDYGIKVGLLQTINTLREDDAFEIKVYFANNYETCAVYFDSIEIPFYAKNISIPKNSTAKSIADIHENARSFFETKLKERTESIKADAKQCRLDDIAEMKQAIKDLESIDK